MSLKTELKKLPKNRAGLVRLLKRYKAYGNPSCERMCPLALYLSHKLDMQVFVYPDGVEAFKGDQFEQETLPLVARRFVEAFDALQIPELINGDYIKA